MTPNNIYNIKYYNMEDYNHLDYKYKYNKYKNKYILLKNQLAGGELPKPVSVFLSGLKYGSMEIPYAGELSSLFFTILSTSELMSSIMQIINSNKALIKLAEINFYNGPAGVVEQFNKIWASLSPIEYKLFCSSIPLIFNKINKAFSNWISTIPTVGPPIAFMLENTKVLTFSHMNEIYKGFPDSAKKLFQHPEELNTIIDAFINHIRKILNVDKKGGSLLSSLSSSVTNKIGQFGQQGLSKVESQFKIASKPAMFALKVAGVDKTVVNSVLDYTIKTIKPATKISIEGLKIIIPLFYTLLLITDKCNNKNK